ncbi:hypothetical protein BU15DRAFT_58695 [Melanogaster broomeanus]|nr:hypothetical protein BU15DRAFT_58695 [Melanogaster broomeanus]
MNQAGVDVRLQNELQRTDKAAGADANRAPFWTVGRDRFVNPSSSKPKLDRWIGAQFGQRNSMPTIIECDNWVWGKADAKKREKENDHEVFMSGICIWIAPSTVKVGSSQAIVEMPASASADLKYSRLGNESSAHLPYIHGLVAVSDLRRVHGVGAWQFCGEPELSTISQSTQVPVNFESRSNTDDRRSPRDWRRRVTQCDAVTVLRGAERDGWIGVAKVFPLSIRLPKRNVRGVRAGYTMEGVNARYVASAAMDMAVPYRAQLPHIQSHRLRAHNREQLATEGRARDQTVSKTRTDVVYDHNGLSESNPELGWSRDGPHSPKSKKSRFRRNDVDESKPQEVGYRQFESGSQLKGLFEADAVDDNGANVCSEMQKISQLQ